MLSDDEYLRFGRQLLLADWGERGQQALAEKCVAIIGVGGLGVPALVNLAGAGVGRLRLIDADTVSLSNLPRQWLYQPQQQGLAKVRAAKAWAEVHNPALRVEAVVAMADDASLPSLLEGVDLVLDCTDNLDARHCINRHCVALGLPLVTAAAVGWQGQLQLVDGQGACFACFSPPSETLTPKSCREAGVAGPVLTAVAGMQALIAIRCLLGLTVPVDQVQRFDAHTLSWRSFGLTRQPQCSVCGEPQ
ncbi:[sulfur carrier protein ThiS] adenylyltransferase [Ferrimonas sediminum]|uniref:[sulfur carrier protein ThiS] adenylyltransferase n=1 Tax=Ferrimonas sediminum TaxID=718193 RepID=A0A1G8VIX2_9GAMM|nr:HesA/MoeB/ThiF family protein [Ferrimonas sediminum]SDJ65864.1 [sulfur carrier protein ThiS] adenylyltransferase [Ferrimonas sediminum]